MFSGSRANSGLVILFLVTVGESQSVTCLPGQGGKGQSPTLKHEQEEKSPGGTLTVAATTYCMSSVFPMLMHEGSEVVFSYFQVQVSQRVKRKMEA